MNNKALPEPAFNEIGTDQRLADFESLEAMLEESMDAGRVRMVIDRQTTFPLHFLLPWCLRNRRRDTGCESDRRAASEVWRPLI